MPKNQNANPKRLGSVVQFPHPDAACAKPGGIAGRICVLILVLIVFLIPAGCSGYKTVRIDDLATLADGIAWYVERTEPKQGLLPEEAEKVQRVGEKVLRNARALAAPVGE